MTFGVTVWCFVLSYIIVAVLEYSRPVLAFSARPYLILGGMALGWLTHTMYLADRMWLDMAAQGLLASWFQWALLVSWGISTLYIVLLIRRMDKALGTFILPLLLGSIAVAFLWRDAPPFQRSATIGLWARIHGISLLIGAMVIIFGLGTGLMYLVQSYRLKHKMKSVRSFRLPSLEDLQWLNRTSIFISCAGLTIGLLSGIVLNLNKEEHINWFSAGIIVPFALCLWSVVAVLLELTTYRSFGGKRTAYLTLANFVFLALVLGLFYLTPHQRTGVAYSPVTPAGCTAVPRFVVGDGRTNECRQPEGDSRTDRCRQPGLAPFGWGRGWGRGWGDEEDGVDIACTG